MSARRRLLTTFLAGLRPHTVPCCRRKELGPSEAAVNFLESARKLCLVWPGAVARLCASDCAQLIGFALSVGAEPATLRDAAGEWLAADAADAALRGER